MTLDEKQTLTFGYNTLSEIITDKNLARLGDAYVNLVYSLALSLRTGRATASRVKTEVLAGALRRSNLRGSLPRRVDKHSQADAAEALIAYSWLSGSIALNESTKILKEEEDPTEGFTKLILTTLKKIRVT
jgi:hypothetical protein